MVHEARLAKCAAILFLGTLSQFTMAQGKRSNRPQAAPTAKAADIAQEKLAIDELHQKDVRYGLAFDVDGMATLWADDIVSMPPGGPALVGRAANLEFLMKQADEIKNEEILSYDEQWEEVNVFGDYAWEWGTIRSRIRPAGAGNEENTISSKVMRVLKRQPDGSYRIARTIWNSSEVATPKPETKKEEAAPAPNRDLTR